MTSKIRYWLLLFSWFSIYFQFGNRSSQFDSKQDTSWEAFSKPLISGGVISQIIADPVDSTHLFALQEQTDEWQTIVESKDAGSHWNVLVNFQHFWIHSIQADPKHASILFMGGDTGIYRSENSGIDWTKVADFGPLIVVPVSDIIYSIEKADISPDCSIGQQNFVRSQDRGNSWKKVPLRCGIYGNISSSLSNPQIIYLRGMDPLSPESQMLAQSNNGGDTWTYLPLSGPYFSMGLFPVYIDPQNPEKLFSSTGTGIIISNDDGHTWKSQLSISIIGTFLFSFSCDEIYAGLVSISMGDVGDVYRSGDGGETWEPLLVNLPANLKTLLINPESSDSIYIGLDGYGIEHSTDAGRTWKNANNGILSTTKVSRLIISPTPTHQVYSIVDWPRPALFKSDNHGMFWSGPLIEKEVLDVISNPLNVNQVWAVSQSGWIESKDGGSNWISVSTISGTNLSISANMPGRPCADHTEQAQGYLVCQIYGIDNEKIWQFYSIPGSKAIVDISISPSNGSIIFAGGTPDYQVGVVYESEDGGTTWKESLRSQPNYLLLDLAISGSNPSKVIAVFEQFQTDNLLVYESLDTGSTWSDVTPEINTVAGNLGTLFTHRAFTFIDASGTIYLAAGNLVLEKPATIQSWQIFGAIDDRIYAAGIETGSPSLLWLAGEKNGWKISLPLHYPIWMPVIFRNLS